MWPVTSDQPFQIRHATTIAELQEFERWAGLADSGGPVTAARLVEAHTSGFLATSLNPAAGGGGDVAALERGGPEAIGWAHSFALIALLDDTPIGGLLAGPSLHWLSSIPPQFGFEPMLQGMIRTTKLHFVSVEESQRRSGAGSALVRAAIETAHSACVDLFYGQFDTSSTHLARFYSDLGCTLHRPGAPLDFSALLGIPGGPVPGPGEAFFSRAFSYGGR
ncbi:GNAT family N-acetyltransferase [Nocardia sp. NPDC048505]|uniref:GNAT family N-acetyltransferase n=1 Tax=Nocardia sp. NPDC048505 TaxID=3155756 RepID=UPI0033D941DB